MREYTDATLSRLGSPLGNIWFPASRAGVPCNPMGRLRSALVAVTQTYSVVDDSQGVRLYRTRKTEHFFP